MSKSLIDVVSELLEMSDESLAAHVIRSNDVQFCLSELYDILKQEEQAGDL